MIEANKNKLYNINKKQVFLNYLVLMQDHFKVYSSKGGGIDELRQQN